MLKPFGFEPIRRCITRSWSLVTWRLSGMVSILRSGSVAKRKEIVPATLASPALVHFLIRVIFPRSATATSDALCFDRKGFLRREAPVAIRVRSQRWVDLSTHGSFAQSLDAIGTRLIG